MRNDIKTNSKSLNCLELDNDPIGAVFDIVWKRKIKDNTLLCADLDNSGNSEDDNYYRLSSLLSEFNTRRTRTIMPIVILFLNL